MQEMVKAQQNASYTYNILSALTVCLASFSSGKRSPSHALSGWVGCGRLFAGHLSDESYSGPVNGAVSTPRVPCPYSTSTEEAVFSSASRLQR